MTNNKAETAVDYYDAHCFNTHPLYKNLSKDTKIAIMLKAMRLSAPEAEKAATSQDARLLIYDHFETLVLIGDL